MSKLIPIKIDFYHDPICPWCFVALKQLLVTLKTPPYSTRLDPTLKLHQFAGNPTLPVSPVSREQNRINTYGALRARQVVSAVSEAISALGYTPNLDGMTGNPIRAARLEEYASTQPLPEGKLGAAYLALRISEQVHTQGHWPSEIDMLARVATSDEFGLFDGDVFKAEKWLEGDELEKQVKAEWLENRRKGVPSVPYILFGDKYAVNGAVGINAFKQVLDKFLV